MALEMDQAFDYMKEIGTYLKEKEDVAIVKECEEMTKNVFEDHMDIMEELNAMMLADNEEADKSL